MNEQRPPFPITITDGGVARNPVRIIIGDEKYLQDMTLTDAEESALAHKLWARALARGEVLVERADELAEAEAVIELVAAWREKQNQPAGAMSGAAELLAIIEGRERTALATVVAAAVAAERERCAVIVLNHPHHISKDLQLVAAIRS